jgi:hypothetical protein
VAGKLNWEDAIMARGWLAIGGIAMIGIGAAVAFGWWSSATAEATGQIDGVSRIRIDNDSGNVSIRTGDVQTTTVREHFDFRWGEPDTSYSIEDGELVLGDCGWWCSADYELIVPEGMAINGDVDSGDLLLEGVASAEVDASSGDVTVRDVSGPVRLDVSSGDVQLSGLGGPVDVDASSGDVIGDGLRGQVKVDASSGYIRLVMVVPQSVTADASSGDIELTVPDVPYRIEGESDSGDREIRVDQGGEAAHTLQLNASSGDVTVHTG